MSTHRQEARQLEAPMPALVELAAICEPEARRLSDECLAPLARTLDGSRRLLAAEERVTAALAELPVSFWDASAGRLAHDLGWTAACARSGTRPACRLAPAIQFIGYDGYPGHGSPRTCTGGCPAHLHLSWASPCYGTSRLSAPCAWVMAFAVLPADYPAAARPGP